MPPFLYPTHPRVMQHLLPFALCLSWAAGRIHGDITFELAFKASYNLWALRYGHHSEVASRNINPVKLVTKSVLRLSIK